MRLRAFMVPALAAWQAVNVFAADTPAPATPPTNVALEALRRLAGMDISQNAALKTAVMKVLDSTRGTPDFVEIVRLFHIKDEDPALLALAVKDPNGEAGVAAMQLLLDHDELDLLKQALAGDHAVNVATALANAARSKAVPLLVPLVADTKRDVAVRKQAVIGLAQTVEGATALLQFAKDDALADDVKLTATMELNGVRWPEIKTAAAEVLPLPRSAGAQALPPVSELLKMSGTAARGAEVFARKTSICTECHRIGDKGVDFAPNLSEIGTKLGKDAIYEAILQPSAGVAVGYETTLLKLKSGDEVYGVVLSETVDDLVMKSKGAVVTRLKKTEIAERRQLKTSIMPDGLQQTMTAQDLVDLVEFLASQKTPGPPAAAK